MAGRVFALGLPYREKGAGGLVMENISLAAHPSLDSLLVRGALSSVSQGWVTSSLRVYPVSALDTGALLAPPPCGHCWQLPPGEAS